MVAWGGESIKLPPDIIMDNHGFLKRTQSTRVVVHFNYLPIADLYSISPSVAVLQAHSRNLEVPEARYMPSLADQTSAAVKIQAWFRGYRERKGLQKHLEERRSFMEAYRGNIAAEEPSDIVDNAALSSRPVHEKIHAAVDMLFDPKMYVSKVGAFILNRLTALSPHLCAYLVIDAQGLAAILDIFEQKTTGRGPATAEILVILQEVFLRIVTVS
ncbi:hypothetical protein COOONC_00259 [Cooperia oncophora]